MQTDNGEKVTFRCPVCGETVLPMLSGVLRGHGDDADGYTCAGSLRAPLELNEELTDDHAE